MSSISSTSLSSTSNTRCTVPAAAAHIATLPTTRTAATNVSAAMPRAASHTAKRPALLSVHLLQIQLQAENPFADHMEDRDLHREVQKRCAQNGLHNLMIVISKIRKNSL